VLTRSNTYSCIVVPNHKYHILGCSNLNYLNESLTCVCGNYLSSRCIASRDDSDMQLFMFDTFRCVEHMYNRHTKKEEHVNVSTIPLMCRFMTLCVADPIWGVCCYSYTLYLAWGTEKYTNPVILLVDSSQEAAGMILSQIDEHGQRRPACYGSVPMSEGESRYSQPKLQLFGLYCALRHWRLHIIGVKNL
jgi:hypothetical protein